MEGQVIVCGNFNAKCGGLSDIDGEPSRFYVDLMKNGQGKLLVDCMRSPVLMFVNGRLGQDPCLRDGVSEDFQVRPGVRQGCILLPLLFNCFMDWIVREVTKVMGGGLHIEYSTSGGLFLSYRHKITALACKQDILHADDLTLVAETRRELQHMLDVLDQAC